MKANTIFEWFIIFLLLIFLPRENKLMLFDTRPEDWYGEILVGDDENTVLVGKNSKDEVVDLGLKAADRTILLQAGQEEGLFVEGLARVLPESLVVVHVKVGANELGRRALMMGDKRYFKPGNLTLMTQSDFYGSYLLMAGLLGGFLALGFVVARYGIESEFAGNIDD